MKEFKKDEMIQLIVERRVPMLVRHGVIAVWDGTYRVIKETARGSFRTKQRRHVAHRSVTQTKTGFLDAFNIIMSAFEEYGYITRRGQYIKTTHKGVARNKLHQRETDTKARTLKFYQTFYKLYKDEIKKYNKENNKGDDGYIIAHYIREARTILSGQ